eukprot:6205575-Pleurochrysis_carterae.AAC.1
MRPAPELQPIYESRSGIDKNRASWPPARSEGTRSHETRVEAVFKVARGNACDHANATERSIKVAIFLPFNKACATQSPKLDRKNSSPPLKQIVNRTITSRQEVCKKQSSRSGPQKSISKTGVKPTPRLFSTSSLLGGRNRRCLPVPND